MTMSHFLRPSGRVADALRPIEIHRGFTKHAEGSVLIQFGDTKVICTASIEDKVPGFLKGKGQGWLTAEYGMLPRSTHTRMDREAAKGKQSGRTQEIQRLIGRSLRAAFDLGRLVSVLCILIVMSFKLMAGRGPQPFLVRWSRPTMLFRNYSTVA